MSARFVAGSSSALTKNIGLIDYTQPYTVLCWGYFLSTPGSDQTTQSINSGSLSDFDLFGRMTGGQTRLTVRSGNGSVITTTGSALALATWYPMGMRRNSSNSLDFILDGAVDQTNTQGTAGRAPVAAQHIGEQVGGFAGMDGWVGAIKEFNVALTLDEIALEMETFLPRIADSRLDDVTPVLPGNRTGSLRGGGWTEIGTVVDAPNPPIAWGGAQILTFPPVATDTTAPILSLPTGIQTGSTTASGTVDTDEANGTLYYLATVNATETAAIIKAGSSQAVTTTGTQNVTVSGLTASTTYFLHYVHDDAAANESNVVASISFTTDAAGGFIAAWANGTNNLMGSA